KRPHEVTNGVPAPQHAERTHFLLLNPELLLAFMAGDGVPTRVSDCVYDKNGPKNGLKVS
ncbi:hypothetical protein, partial [Corynebacterium sp. MSK012]|uniref:hypothetical protein n=1 Tax=Corynebacterium sp. MSK012 TaxID=3050189 RepID=UPI00254B52EF